MNPFKTKIKQPLIDNPAKKIIISFQEVFTQRRQDSLTILLCSKSEAPQVRKGVGLLLRKFLILTLLSFY